MCRVRPNGRRGFTLIEVLAVMLIAGVMVAVAGMGIVTGTRSYLMSSNNVHLGQKAQLAMARLTREMRGMSAIVAETFSNPAAPISYLIYDSLEGRRAISREGDEVRLYRLSPLASDLTGTGDALVDGLATDADALSIRFRRENGDWVLGENAMSDLNRIDIDLRFHGNDVQATEVAFATSVYPRSR